MAKYFGNIGFVKSVEDPDKPGFWRETVETRPYYGDVLTHQFKNTTPTYINGEITLSNSFSIVADEYANANFGYMKFIEYKGTAWSISNIEVEYPRLIINVGGVYNGKTVSTGSI